MDRRNMLNWVLAYPLTKTPAKKVKVKVSAELKSEGPSGLSKNR